MVLNHSQPRRTSTEFGFVRTRRTTINGAGSDGIGPWADAAEAFIASRLPTGDRRLLIGRYYACMASPETAEILTISRTHLRAGDVVLFVPICRVVDRVNG